MIEIKNFPGYFITEDGRVYSAIKQERINRRFVSYLDYSTLTELKTYKQTQGYYIIKLYKNKKVYNKLIHRLVAEHYIENPHNLPQVNHIDENKTNNQVSNLEWVTGKQNSIHSRCRQLWHIENIVTGEIVEVINISDFARDNNLTRGALYGTLEGTRNHHKNFRVLSRTQFK